MKMHRRAVLASRQTASFLLGFVLIVAVVLVSNVPAPEFPPPGSAEARLPSGADTVRFAVRAGSAHSRQVTVVAAGRQTSFLDRSNGTGVFVIDLPVSPERAPGIKVSVEPSASVLFDPPRRVGRPQRPRLKWVATDPPLRLPPPLLATSGREWAEASVDETDTYGLRLFGVPVRAAPSVEAPLVETVTHGQRLRARCWSLGDVVTNGMEEEPFDDNFTYSSLVWFKVETSVGHGFLPDVRFSRRGNVDRLHLPACQ